MRTYPRRTVRMLAAAMVLFSIIALSACSDKSLQEIAKGELAVSTACSAAFQTVTQAAALNPPLIDQQTANNIVQVLLRIEQANQQAETATQQISTLSAANKANLMNILQPIQAAIVQAVNTGTVGIKDPKTKAAVDAALAAVQVAVTAVATTVNSAKATGA